LAIPKPRIVAVHSIQNGLTSRRIRRNQTSAYLSSYDVAYCFAAAASSQPQPVEPYESFSPPVPLDADRLRDYLAERLRWHNPDLLIVHTGFVFWQNVDVYRTVLAAIARSHPDLPIALDVPLTRPEHPDGFSAWFPTDHEVELGLQLF
jgi:hypothetical protein